MAKSYAAIGKLSPDELRDVVVGLVRMDGFDLSARQLSIFLVTNLEPGPHTVRGLAARLDVSRPAISMSLDRLSDLDIVKRIPDPADRRSVLVARTRKGASYLATIERLVSTVAKSSSSGVEPTMRRRAA